MKQYPTLLRLQCHLTFCQNIHSCSFSQYNQLFYIKPCHEKTCCMPYANNKGADQPAHPRSLISAFVVHCLDSIIPLISISEISSLSSFCGCTGRFESRLIANPEDRFSRDEAHMRSIINDSRLNTCFALKSVRSSRAGVCAQIFMDKF